MLSEQQKRDFCAKLLQLYGIQLDTNNELLPVFYVAYQSTLITENTSKQSNEMVLKIIQGFEKNTASKINQMEVKQYRFQSPKEAFWFAFGKLGVVGCLVAVLFFAGWLVHSYQWKEKQRATYFANFLDQQPLLYRQINDSVRASYIRLQPSKSLQKAKAGQNYVFQRDCQCVEIPLYFETEIKQ